MGSSKKRKKHKSERREKYEEYSNNMDPSQLQRGLKLILKVGGNNTPEYINGSGNGNGTANNLQPAQFALAGPPTAAQAMCSSPIILEEMEHYRNDKHKKSKKKKKKKDREKRHKHHKEKRKDKSERCLSKSPQKENSAMDYTEDLTLIASHDSQSMLGTFNSRDSPKLNSAGLLSSVLPSAEADSSQGDFSFIDDDNSQPLAENMLFFAGITTDSSPSCRPISKPIKPNKPHELTVDSSTSNSIQSSSLHTPIGSAVKRTALAISPNKPLSDVIVLSPTASMSALTPGGGSISTALSPKTSEAGRTPNSSSDSGREPRTCVLKLKQQKSPLNKLLEHLLRGLEKRDPHQFFAWPVTDDIAPGYSRIISKPMDFSTMRQKIDENVYTTLGEFTDDFRLMCENAIKYNHVDTVYHKAAKRLLQVGMKHLSPETLTRSLKSLANYLKELTVKELGFELNQYGGEYNSAYEQQSMIDSADEGASTGADEPLTQIQLEAEEKRKLLRLENLPKTRFEPFVDDMTSEEILAQVQGAAQTAKKLLSIKENAKKIGFLRQNKDGTTSLNILIKDENSGPEKVINLGDVVGKLKNGSGQTHYYREDKRNEAKLVKPLHYGPFASFAPTFDSRFSTLNKEETQLVMQTYGDAASTEYAESILQFTKDSNYASMLANGLLDVLTNGEHSKCMEDLYDLQVQNYEQQEALKCFNNLGPIVDSSVSNETKAQIEKEYENYKNIRIDFNRLRTLSDLGIEVDFLDDIEKEMKNFELTRRLQEHLSNNLNLIHKLRNTQHERLSQPLPHHLAFVSQPSQEENQLANQLTQQLIDAAKNLPPSAIAEPYSLRKAMGLSYVGLPVQQEPTTPRLQIPAILQTPVSLPNLNFPTVNNQTTAINMATSLSMDLDEDGSTSAGGDLENELREFLESGSDLHVSSTNPDDNLVAQLLMN